MPIRNSAPVSFFPVGLTDAVDQSSAFPGACQLLQNFIFDRNNRGAVISRPGVKQETIFPSFSSPGVISITIAVGTLIYGMIATARTVGFDEPFCYDTVAQAFIVVSGVTSGNVPATQAINSNWSPPTMDVIGTKLVVTHPGFSGGNYIGWFDVSNPAAPAWSAGNTSTNALPSAPIWVAQFYGRAFYGCKNSVIFSDELAATAISNTNFAGALTLGDTSYTTVATGLPVDTSSNGILQSLVVFKDNSIWQITGDLASTSQPLSLNKIFDGVGCSMPRTSRQTPYGIVFVASDGPRVINLRGEVLYLNGGDSNTPDIVYPFASATYKSRVCAGYNNGIYRVGFDGNLSLFNFTFTHADYWYDFIFGRWNGPHTFAYSSVVSVGSKFYLSSDSTPGILFESDPIPLSSSVYLDNGAAFKSSLISACFPDNGMAMSSVVESTIELSKSTTGVSYFIQMHDDQSNPLAIATISINPGSAIWGTSIYKTFNWRSSAVSSHAVTIPWDNPIVYKKGIISVSSTASVGVSVKQSSFRVQKLGYTNV